ncbi:MAG: hypothetical protein ACXWJM_05875 [Ramlibacter sp.]
MPTPIRFPTEAANADSMQDNAPGPAAKGAPRPPGAQKQPPPDSRDSAMKPGEDINTPGFVRDKDAGKP